jgi:3-oxoacyl-[acyl-carrier protein] reductase
MLLAKTALVTGAARGIGLAISERLAAEGARVVLADIDGVTVRLEGERLSRAGLATLALEVDVTNPAQVEKMVADARSKWGGLDVLVNNAGIAGPAKPTWEYTPEEWGAVIGVDLIGVFLCCRAAVPSMLEQGGGRIVNVGSSEWRVGNANMSAYSSSKASVIGFTNALAKEVAKNNIYVNCITPAVIETDILHQLNDDAVDYMVSRIPMGRTGKPEEVASMVAWLSSEDCSFTTGAVFDISGGRATY